MSVFQLQEWWGLKVSPDNDEYDISCFVVGNVDNASPPSDKIAVGSQRGLLQIFHPTRASYRIEDLVYEGLLGQPILQVLLGRFIPSTDSLGLAVLHPRELAVYEVIPQGGGKDGRVNFHTLQRLYKHDLGLGGKHFTAYNMCMGAFGGSRGRDMLLVQSMDGKLQVFEQSANAFSRQLVDCLLPGPLLYLPRLDAFVTAAHTSSVECYRYQVLAASQQEQGGGRGSAEGVRPALVEWAAHLGGGAGVRQLLLGTFSTSSSTTSSPPREVLAVCDKSLFLLKADSGGLVQQRLLGGADASCACVASTSSSTSSSSSEEVLLLATQDGVLQVFVGLQLAWAARCPSTPVHLSVGTFGGVRGLIVSIDAVGRLAVSYLGTKPPVAAVLTRIRDMDYDKIDEEHRGLLAVIREAQAEGREPQGEQLLIKSQLPRAMDTDGPETGTSPAQLVSLEDGRWVKATVRLFLSFAGDRKRDVSLVISAPAHLLVTPRTLIIKGVGGIRSTPSVVALHVFALRTSSCTPSGAQLTVTASYCTSSGEPRVAAHSLALPLWLSLRPRTPSKTAYCKVVLDTEHPAAPLTEVFADVLAAYGGGEEVDLGANATQALGLQLHGTGALVSILVSKSAGRYRLQADSFPALALVLGELERRLTARLQGVQGVASVMSPKEVQGVQGPEVRFLEALPLDAFLLLAEQHLLVRHTLLALSTTLEAQAAAFRMIEKRLLVRFKDRNPTALGGLDVALGEAYEALIATADEVQAQEKRQTALRAEIEGFAKLLAALAAMKYGLPLADRTALQCHLCPEQQGGAAGWEEEVTASLTHLLRTALSSKASKEVATGAALEIPKNTEALRKALLLVMDRLDKGGRITAPASASAAATAAPAAAPLATAAAGPSGTSPQKASRK